MKKLAVIKTPNFNVVDIKGRAITSSRNIAEVFEKEHKHVMEAIRNCEASETFSRSNFRLSTYTDSRGKIQTEYFLTKNGFAFIALGFTGKKAAQFKETYIKKFDEMESILTEKKTNEWKQSRTGNKIQNAILMDAVKAFQDYCKSNGSTNFGRYYNSIPNLLNETLDIEKGKRDLTESNVLMAQSLLMNVFTQTIYEEMEKQTPYKKIYQALKSKAEQFKQYFQPQKLRITGDDK